MIAKTGLVNVASGCKFQRNLLVPVAQLDRVPGYEPGGRVFESRRARHSKSEKCKTKSEKQNQPVLFKLFTLHFSLELNYKDISWTR